jgi:peptide/nickel transport system permease protein
MSEAGTLHTSTAETPPRAKEWRRLLRVFFSRGVVVFGLITVVIFILVAIFAPLISPYNPNQQDLRSALQGPSWRHLLGTDNFGRDTLSRIIYGSRVSLMVGVLALGIAAVIGMSLGLIAGYLGGWTHAIIMRAMDALMAFPMLVLALLIAALLGGGIVNVMIALGISLIPGYARLMCGQVMTTKENDYVLAERSLGASDLRIMLRHVFPNCMPPLIVMITMTIGITILSEASLSFLGIGIEAPMASWGAMVNTGYQYLLSSPMMSFAPGMAIMLVVFGFNMVGDGLRDALDPRLRGVL